MYSRQKVVDLIESWVGLNEKDGSHKKIINIYNSYSGQLPRNIKMQSNWAWCACTWSALAIELGYTDIMPIEISCGYLIEKAKEMGCWVEDDSYIPKPGDAVLYDWQDTSGKADNGGWPDHIGTVTYVNEAAGYFVVTEGNYQDSVKKRTVLINGVYIRGFIVPRYDEWLIKDSELKFGLTLSEVAHEVIIGIWGNGDERKKNLAAHGYDYKSVQEAVNKILNGSAVEEIKDNDQNQPIKKRVITPCYAMNKNDSFAGRYKTTANLYCRVDAGKNKKAICKIPEGTIVRNYGYYNLSDGREWLLIQVVLDAVEYTGFSHIGYLCPLDGKPA